MFSSFVLFWSLFLLPLVRSEVHNVVVGGSDGTLMFNPEAIFASPGDQVVFTFQQKNHSAVQSSFANPCGAKDGGFNSGFFPVDASVNDNFPTYTIIVNDTNPVWVYCSQAAGTANSHCGKGMVFAVNCGPDGAPNSFTNFKNAALAIGAQLAGSASASSASDPYATSPGSSSGAATAPASTTAAAAPATHTVIVGANNSLSFTPAELSAQPNDVVVFQFQAKNHTVTQSSFAAPCQKLASTSGSGGFDSGFMPVSANATTFPTYSITVNNTDPIWVYCRQNGHCGQGMVLAINAVDNGPKNFTAFQAAARQINGTASNSTSSGSGSSQPSTTASGATRAPGVATACLGLMGAVYLFLLWTC